MSEEDITRFYASARAIICTCAKYNELGIDLNNVYLFIDPTTLKYEVGVRFRRRRSSRYYRRRGRRIP